MTITAYGTSPGMTFFLFVLGLNVFRLRFFWLLYLIEWYSHQMYIHQHLIYYRLHVLPPSSTFFHLPLTPSPHPRLGGPRAPALHAASHVLNSHWSSILYIWYTYISSMLFSHHPSLAFSHWVQTVSYVLLSCPAQRIIGTVSSGSHSALSYSICLSLTSCIISWFIHLIVTD